MALSQSALLEVLDGLKEADFADHVRSAAATIYQALIEAELTSVIGAEPHERPDARTAQRNGHRPRTLSTTAGDLELRIPKLRTGTILPALLERRRRVDQGLYAVVMEGTWRRRSCAGSGPARRCRGGSGWRRRCGSCGSSAGSRRGRAGAGRPPRRRPRGGRAGPGREPVAVGEPGDVADVGKRAGGDDRSHEPRDSKGRRSGRRRPFASLPPPTPASHPPRVAPSLRPSSRLGAAGTAPLGAHARTPLAHAVGVRRATAIFRPAFAS